MMLKKISKSSVMLRGAFAPDVSQDHFHGLAKNSQRYMYLYSSNRCRIHWVLIIRIWKDNSTVDAITYTGSFEVSYL
jgi:hypothetical protein